jgi:beta-aspartyl-peptidase (threonine type)
MPPRTHGTVGAVALDRAGNLAAGTSTGGRTNKMAGRVGDTPVIGAGTYADNATCAVSATGHGEFFVRMVVAHDIAARMRYAQSSLTDAANDVVLNKLEAGSGGVIAIDRHGNVVMPFNTERMFRGYMGNGGGSRGRSMVGIFRE